MRRIITQEIIDAKKKRNKWILVSLLTLILLGSTAGYAFLRDDFTSSNNNNGETRTYNGYNFISNGNYWVLSTDNADLKFYFTYTPDEVSNVNINGNYSLQDYVDKPIYFVNPDAGSNEVILNLQSYVLRYQEACLNGDNCSNKDLPIKSCDNNIIIFNGLTSESTNSNALIYKNQSCVYISGNSTLGADAFVYKLLGII